MKQVWIEPQFRIRKATPAGQDFRPINPSARPPRPSASRTSRAMRIPPPHN